MKITVQHLMAGFLRLTVFLYYDNPSVTAFMGAKLTLFQALISRLLFTRIALLRKRYSVKGICYSPGQKLIVTLMY